MDLKIKLMELTGLTNCVLTGRGATAIYLILKALNLPEGSEVIMPSFLCPSPGVVTKLAKLNPIFCDVGEDCNINISTVKPKITSNTRVIIAPHIFGTKIKMEPIITLAKKHDIFIIEDCAQAVENGLGGKGDATIFSFGKTKLVDAGYGGAVLTNDPLLAKKIKEIECELPEVQLNKSEKFYYLMNNALEKNLKIDDFEEYKTLFIFKYDNSKTKYINEALSNLETNLEKRKATLTTLCKELPELKVVGPGIHRGCFFVNSSIKRDKIVRDLREKNLWVGTLYTPINRVFSNQKDSEFPNAIYAKNHIINFILTPNILEKEPLDETIKIVKSRLKKPQIVLLLGGSHFYAPAIPIIQSVGAKVLLVDRDENPIGKALANYFEVVDIIDKNGVLQIAKKYDVDAIMAVNDYGVLTAAYVANALNLVTNSEEVALASIEKLQMRNIWKKEGVKIPKFKLIHSLKEAKNAALEIGYPVIIKPSGNMGASRGIQKANSNQELHEAFNEAIKYDENILIEECVIGTEHSVEGVIQNGNVTIFGISQKIKTPEPVRVDLAVFYPSQLFEKQQIEVINEVTKAAKSLGLKNGAVHAEICYTKNGPVLFEIASRPGGGRIPSDCLPLFNCTNQTKALTEILLGKHFTFKKCNEKGVVLGFIIAKPGKVIDTSPCNKTSELEYVHACESFKKVGDIVNEVKAGGDRAGYFIVTANSLDEALDYYNQLCDSRLIITR